MKLMSSAWILRTMSRAPCGARGLKLAFVHHLPESSLVAPRAGRVD